DIFEQLELKEKQFSVFESATEQNMERFWKSVLEVDNSLVPEDMFKKYIENKPHILEFIDYCYCSRIYFFEIRKCQEAKNANKDHYMPFCEIYSRETSEKYRPSSLQKATSLLMTTTNNLGVNGSLFTISSKSEEESFLKTLLK
ncbi:18719_t:CDS:2, partial [Racocetra persica]